MKLALRPTIEQIRACKGLGRNEKLTDDQVGELRLRKAKGVTTKELALFFGVSENTVRKLVKGAEWR